MNNVEMAKHFRKRLKADGIKARVRSMAICGSKVVMVSVPGYEARFNEDEIRTICNIAVANGLTGAYGLPVNVEIEQQLTNKMEWTFEVRV